MPNKKFVTFGEIMLRLSPLGHLRTLQTNSFDIYYAGSEANVAVSLALFGLNSSYVSALSNNYLGTKTLFELKKLGVDTQHIIQSDKRQGLVFIEKGSMNRPSKVIYDRDHSAFSQLKPGSIDWKQIFKSCNWFHWSGITPSLSDSMVAVTKEALVEASANKVTVSVDLNYRSNLWKYGKNATDVMPELMQYCDVIIGNEEDASKCLGVDIACSDASYNDTHLSNKYNIVAQQILMKFPNIQNVCFSLRQSINADRNLWSGVIVTKDSMHSSENYELTDIVDRVGAGDAFAAGIIYSLNNFNGNYKEVIDFAVAASALKHSIEGDFNIVSLEEVKHLVAGHGTGRINR